MRDFERLRRQLRIAVFGLAAACGPSGKAPTGPTTAAAPDAGGGTSDGRVGVMSTPAQNCTTGQWCGPADKPRRFATGGVPERLGCPTDAADPDGTGFRLNDAETEKARKAGQADACCYEFTAGCWDDRVIEGRQLGTVFTSSQQEHNHSAFRSQRWLDAARAEHASVASFARHTLELMAVGAPPELLMDVQRAAMDEVRHAQSAFALAGGDWQPGPLPAVAPRQLDVVGVAVSTFVEGCVCETVALLRAQRELAACTDVAERAHLAMVVADETRHAALAWRTVKWAMEQGGEPVTAALRTAAMQVSPPEHVAESAKDAWHGVVMPLLAELLATAANAPAA